MTVEVRLFAAARQVGGASSVSVEIPEFAPVGQLRARLGETFPALAPVLASSRIAVDSAYVDDGFAIPPGAEVALIPPVSGGSLG